MDKVQKPINSECYTPSSEPIRIYMEIYVPPKCRALSELHDVTTQNTVLPIYECFLTLSITEFKFVKFSSIERLANTLVTYHRLRYKSV
jgi:hypothetical protein